MAFFCVALAAFYSYSTENCVRAEVTIGTLETPSA